MSQQSRSTQTTCRNNTCRINETIIKLAHPFRLILLTWPEPRRKRVLCFTSSKRSQALYGGPLSDTNPAKAMPSNTLGKKSFSSRPRWPRKAACTKKNKNKDVKHTGVLNQWVTLHSLQENPLYNKCVAKTPYVSCDSSDTEWLI